MVKKFLKYPQLGNKASDEYSLSNTCINSEQRWTSFSFSNFFSQLTLMREVFKAVYGESFKEGKTALQLYFLKLNILELIYLMV